MPVYKGIEYKTLTKLHPDTQKYVVQFSLTQHTGPEVIVHPYSYVLIKGMDDLAMFDTENKAIEAAESVARNRIDDIV